MEGGKRGRLHRYRCAGAVRLSGFGPVRKAPAGIHRQTAAGYLCYGAVPGGGDFRAGGERDQQAGGGVDGADGPDT